MDDDTISHLREPQLPELQIRELAGELSLMMETVPVQMWFLTDIDTYGRVNRHHADFLGKTKQELEFRKLEDFLSAESASVCKRSNARVYDSRSPVDSEEWLTNAAGESRLMKITKTPHFDSRGNIESIVCFGIDITDQRKTEETLARSEANFRTFIETIADIVVVGDNEGRILYANPSASARLGYSPEELRGMPIIDLHPPYVRNEAATILADMLGGRRDSCPLPLMDRHGATVPVETRVWAGLWNGQDCIFGLSKDLSAEQEALQKFDRLFRMNPAPMAVSTMQDKVFTNVNDAFTQTLGFSAGEVLGHTSIELHLFVKEDEYLKVARKLDERGSIRDFDLDVRTKDGRIRHGLFSGEIIESQGVKYLLTVMIDITERRLAEAERENTIQELTKALAEIKTLRGIVPICASCKRVRDDKGYWQQVEAYVSRHTEAQFSHGICPSCLEKLYPDYCRDDDDRVPERRCPEPAPEMVATRGV